MGVLTDSGVIPPVVQTYFDRALLSRALPLLVHARVAERRPLKQRSGNTMVFRRVESLSLATTPLVEGTPPSGQKVSHTDISVKIQQWGDYITIADLIKATIDHPLLNDANKVLGEQAAQTIDVLMREEQCAGTNVFYGGGVAGRANLTTTTQKVDANLLVRMIRALFDANASRFTKIVTASVKVDTHPIRAAFWAITHPDVVATLETLDEWVPVSHYSGSSAVMEAEVGAFRELRFLASSGGTTDALGGAKVLRGGGGTAAGDVYLTSGNADVYFILAFGEEAVAAVPLEGMSLENIIKPIGSGGPSDPLNQIGTSGWKHTGARKRLNETFMVRAEVTAGLLAP
jgi:N4-gp56 family major capsid protein